MRNRIRLWALHAYQLRQRGQGLVEYGLLLLFIAIVAVASVTTFGTSVFSIYSRVGVAF